MHEQIDYGVWVYRPLLKNWEAIVSNASKRSSATFFDVRPFAEDRYNVSYKTHGIEKAAEWARTMRGGRQFDLFFEHEEIPACSSNYGLCELPDEISE